MKCKSTSSALASSVKRPRESVLYLTVSAYLTVPGFSVHPAIRDHQRRLIEISFEEQEDRLYLVILAVLFLVCIMGSYYAFNKTKLDSQGRVVSSNALVDELWNSYRSFRENMDTQARSWPPYQPDLPVQMPIPGSQH